MRAWPAAVLAALLAGGCAGVSAPASYAIDPTHSVVTFEARHFGTSTSRGRFERISGSVQLDRGAQTGHVEVRIATASLSTGTAALDSRLREPDLLASAAYPEAVFVGDSFVFDGDRLSAVRGQLSLRGQSLPLTLKASGFNCYLNPLLLRQTCGGDFEATLAPSRWGMASTLGMPDTIRLLVQVEAIRE